MPLSLVPLAFSIVGIAVAALAVAASAAALAVFVLYGVLGRDGLDDFMTEARFDPVLKARLAAFSVSAVYVGSTLATLAAARLRGMRSTWPALLAAGPARWPVPRWRVISAPSVVIATLGYGVAFTAIQIAGRERHLMIAGPTDFLLLGTLAANLVVLAPFAEELFFRGWLYTGLRARWRFLPSYLFVVVAFAAIHWDANHRHMLRVLPLALAVGLIREMTGSIRPTIALHAAYNFVIVAMTLVAV